MGWLRLTTVISLLAGVLCQDDDEERTHEQKLCQDKSAGELFRLKAGKDNCRDVIQCTAAGLQAIRCPPGLAFDVEKQTCDWKSAVKNCDSLTKKFKVKPLLVTDEPLCAVEGQLACGTGDCVIKEKFCDGKEDCSDGSDENSCDQDTDPNRAPICDTTICKLPDCFCSESGNVVPGSLCPNPDEGPCERVPQMITITFDDAINNNNIDLYNEIFNRKEDDGTFNRRLNPNGCDIKATFFVSHKYTNYSAVENLYQMGHEIAAHSISHNDDEEFWSKASVGDWAKEMTGSRQIAVKFGNVIKKKVQGIRAPYLRVGGNNQFQMMQQQKFEYDSTMTAPLQNPPLWPYSLLFRMPHSCHGNLQNCPTRAYKVWEIPLNELDRRDNPTSDEDLAGCGMVDSCSNIVSGDQFYNFLTHNFYRHFDQNRAPLGLYFHAAWLKNNPIFFDAFLYWIDEVSERHPEAYFVTQAQIIDWMKNPTEVNDIPNFEKWQEKCSPSPRTDCLVANACKLSNDNELPGESLLMYTCSRCPQQYPWLNDPKGLGRRRIKT